MDRPTSSATSSSKAASRLSTISRHLDAEASPKPVTKRRNIEKKGDEVLFETRGHTGIYKLNRPKKLNTINWAVVDLLREKILTWRSDDAIKVIIGTGDSRAFCAGGDVLEIMDRMNAKTVDGLDFFKDEFEMDYTAAFLEKPYVAIMDGVTMGGGCGVAFPAPIRVATPRTIYAMPETKIGFAPDVGVLYYLAQLDGYVGAWLAVTGSELYGRAVFELGLATDYIQPNAIPTLIDDISSLPSPTLPFISSLIPAPPPPSSSALSSKANPDGSTHIRGAVREFIDATFSLGTIPEILTALRRAEEDPDVSKDVRRFAKEQRETMETRGPTGMALALEGYRKARREKRLDRVFIADLAIMAAYTGLHRITNDFIAGVTSVLVHRGKRPAVWEPANHDAPGLRVDVLSDRFLEGRGMKGIPPFEADPPVKAKDGEPDELWGKWRKWCKA
ncbi:hypothetical protein IAT38_008056 [Cryptococcus sp. DSM 104549]